MHVIGLRVGIVMGKSDIVEIWGVIGFVKLLSPNS